MTGINARVRAWWLNEVAHATDLPEELVSKIRLLEGMLPIIGRLAGLGAVRSIADLIPEDDTQTEAALRALHTWTGRMLSTEEVST